MKFSEKFEQTAQRLNTLSAAMLQLGAQIDRLAKEQTALANEYHAIQTQFQKSFACSVIVKPAIVPLVMTKPGESFSVMTKPL